MHAPSVPSPSQPRNTQPTARRRASQIRSRPVAPSAQVALIAGAGDVGLALARVLLRAGMRVQLTDNSVLRLSHAARSLPGPVGCHLADLRRNTQVECLAEEIAAKGGCDLLIHTPDQRQGHAQRAAADPLLLSDADWQEPWESTFMSAMRTARAVVPQMVRNGRGQVIFITPPEAQTDKGSAPVAGTGAGSLTAHAAAGAALAHFSQAIADQYRARGVQFATLPGPDAGDDDGFETLGAEILARSAAQLAASAAVSRAVAPAAGGDAQKPKI